MNSDTTTTWNPDTLTALGKPDVLTDEERSLRRLPMKEIHVRDDYFQPRQFLDNESEIEKAIAEFTRLIHSGVQLPPIQVMKIEGRWYVIDGHHRLEAFWRATKERKTQLRKMGRSGRERTHVAVKVFNGSIRQAKDEALRRNVPYHVNLSLSDKTQEAWQRVTEGKHTQREIWEVSSISERTVKFMVATLAKVRGLYPDVNFAKGWKWRDVLRLVHGQEPLTDQESLDRHWVESKSRHFQKSFGDDLRKKTRLFARVIHKGDAPTSLTLGQELLSLDRQAKDEEALRLTVEEDAEEGEE